MRRAVAAIGLCSWDRFVMLDRYPDLGEYAIVQSQFEQAGGTTSNTCAALGMLEVEVVLSSVVGRDREGDQLIESLEATGCDTSMIERREDQSTDSSIILVPDSGEGRDRTILWVKGAQPRHGDKLPLEILLDHRWLIIDVNDDRLREFLLELPAHLSPRTQLVGAMTYLTDMDRERGWQHLLRHDMAFGNRRELMHLTGASDFDTAIDIARTQMPGSSCRVIYVTQGAEGALAIRPERIVTVPAFSVEVVDTTGAGDAFAAGCLWGLTEGLQDEEVLTRGNAVGALCCTARGARDGHPTRADVLEFIQRGTQHSNDSLS